MTGLTFDLVIVGNNEQGRLAKTGDRDNHFNHDIYFIYKTYSEGGNRMANRPVEQSRAVIQSMITLASAALGLMCALAWNDAIKNTMKSLLGEDDNLAGLYTYAILATIIAVVVLLPLAPNGRADRRRSSDR